MPSFYIEIDKPAKVREVSSVAVTNGPFVLMGIRKDDQKWTLPGGHLEEDEDKTDGAKRELMEEAGIEATNTQLEHLGSEQIVCHDGEERLIHAFRFRTDGTDRATMQFDPDDEIEQWLWVDCSGGLPADVERNLHSPKDVALGLIDVQKSESVFFIKSRKGWVKPGHKYIRRELVGDSWVYIYHEGEQKKGLHDDIVDNLIKAAGLGDSHAKELVDEMREHSIKEIGGKIKNLDHEYGYFLDEGGRVTIEKDGHRSAVWFKISEIPSRPRVMIHNHPSGIEGSYGTPVEVGGSGGFHAKTSDNSFSTADFIFMVKNKVREMVVFTNQSEYRMGIDFSKNDYTWMYYTLHEWINKANRLVFDENYLLVREGKISADEASRRHYDMMWKKFKRSKTGRAMGFFYTKKPIGE